MLAEQSSHLMRYVLREWGGHPRPARCGRATLRVGTTDSSERRPIVLTRSAVQLQQDRKKPKRHLLIKSAPGQLDSLPSSTSDGPTRPRRSRPTGAARVGELGGTVGRSPLDL